MSGRVAGKVVLLTGAARGQGRSHAVRLAEEGADIVGVDICADIESTGYPMATRDDLEETVRLVEKAGRRMVPIVADVRDRAAMEQAVATALAEFGKLDVVISNAGIAPVGPNSTVQSFLDAIDVTFVGFFNLIRAAYPHLGPGASIIGIGSVASLTPNSIDSISTGPGGAGYGHGKRALARLVNDLALQLAPHGIRVNGVHPTNCNTDLLHNEPMYKLFRPDVESPTRAEAEQGFPAMQAMRIPYIEPEDVSHAIVYLASDESRYVTGTQMRVDGGSIPKNVPQHF